MEVHVAEVLSFLAEVLSFLAGVRASLAVLGSAGGLGMDLWKMSNVQVERTDVKTFIHF